ncbi:CTD kinase subunit gamma CTK3-domain-containing protein [Kockovaella imperatae]|uniref:CTD kinase subunit gamma CTK3-domain-containing protein n=1 Tax=Kockovaella imperatae TaxID=4999 RepID=A0A1Y1UDF6_9TREE|nr:CTD kinase subunit gamma CTK3-domain-containing protein [Kockovaella imperatae]ORX35577.1 CTD kinase subunit gamma CTK3-domain-containing protein [Kockovaella imperatae]
MSFDAFEARLQFLQLLRKLNASSQSIQKVVSFAVKNGARCGDDLWECILDESAKGSLNTRINILYFLDSLLDTSLALGPPDAPYASLIARNLGKIVSRVVPETREGVLNAKAARQILESWRTRRLLESGTIDEAVQMLETRKPTTTEITKRSRDDAFSRSDILRRMEEDRERHKRLRERIWILPIPPLAKPPSASPSASSPFTPASPSTSQPADLVKAVVEQKMLPPPKPDRRVESALEVEFEQTWDGVSDLDEGDFDAMRGDAAILAVES